ncbi:MAG: cadmium-translocating P-type ATPase [Erysipelotrichaceae bacterium]|jgi:Cd2+/Zn2+-exporting ATPase|nr:cadmium-translocating P-type ATPase [Erysipelotrichaceae bacterium]
MTTYTYYFTEIDCPNCAARVEAGFNKIEGIQANIDFMQNKVIVKSSAVMDESALFDTLNQISSKLEPGSAIHRENPDQKSDHTFHSHEHEHSKNNPFLIGRMILSGALLLIGILCKQASWSFWILPTAYILIGYDILYSALSNILAGSIFDENFLMCVASLGAMALGDQAEAVGVMLFYQVGEYFQNRAVDQSRKSIESLMDIRPDSATLLVGDSTKVVSPEEVKVGDLIVIKPGERIPLDGKVVSGEALLDTMALTGESLPRSVSKGDAVLSGSIVTDALLKVEVSKTYGQSTVAKILQLVENATANKAVSEKFITRFARVYTPIVCLIAFVIAAGGSLYEGALSTEFIHRALIFLVISCPCALVISVPLSFFAGIGGIGKAGVLLKGSNHLETLAKLDTVVFDKTGTLTKGDFKVSEVIEANKNRAEILRLAALVEQSSTHPIAVSIVEAAGKPDPKVTVSDVREIFHQGMSAMINKQRILVGNETLMKENNIDFVINDSPYSKVYVAVDDLYAGLILLSDTIKDDAIAAVKSLKEIGIQNTVLLSGDVSDIALAVAKKVGVDQAYGQMYPSQKVEKVKELMDGGNVVGFIGDGINDAPVLVSANLGVAMGGIGSDAALEAADAIIMDDKPSKLSIAIKGARKTVRIVKQNIVFALALKAVFLLLGALGLTNMWMAVFADVGVALLAVVNAMRALKVPS